MCSNPTRDLFHSEIVPPSIITCTQQGICGVRICTDISGDKSELGGHGLGVGLQVANEKRRCHGSL